MSKPIILYSHHTGPNPWKVAIIMEELGIPYETKFMDMQVLHQPEFEKINPNGRVPAIEDPNTGVTLWESGAIIEYLVQQYDKQNKLSYGDKSPEKYLLQQWLHFQVSGQGPYWGQKAWFTHFHSEKIPSAVDRYEKEIKRTMGVIDKHLQDNGTGWLVGNKCTYADLSFLGWNMLLPFLLGESAQSTIAEFPNFKKWDDAMMARPAVAKVAEDKKKAPK